MTRVRSGEIEEGDAGVADRLPLSLLEVLRRRGIVTKEALAAFLHPSLEHLAVPGLFPDMKRALDRLLSAIQLEEPIGIYADRDVDGLAGLGILARTLRTLGGEVVWGCPVKGRGLERATLEQFIQKNVQVMVCVDCGSGEHEQLEWLAAQGVQVIVADHHRLSEQLPPALAWIHPGVLPGLSAETPAGCVMAFKLAHALWLSFLGNEDEARMDYFLFSHLDILALGILADRVPLTGENRVFTALGLRRLSDSRKAGLSALTHFFRLTPRAEPITVEEASWQLIPMLNAAGRLGRSDITAELLLTEDPAIARERIDDLLALNTIRRQAQDKSLAHFEQAVLDQCAIDSDPVLIAIGTDQEPSVTGLAAQSLVQKYERPVFLFVNQGDETVGSGRGGPGVDLYAWVQQHERWLVKYGGHQGAVGLTLRTADFTAFRASLLASVQTTQDAVGATIQCESEWVLRPARRGEIAAEVEADLPLSEINAEWWEGLQRLAPFGQGHPWPVFKLTGIETIQPVPRRRKRPCQDFIFKGGGTEVAVQFDEALAATCPDLSEKGLLWDAVGYPIIKGKGAPRFHWIIQHIRRQHG